MPKVFKTDEQTTNDTETANGEATGWEAPQAAAAVKPCVRHTFKGGDTCIRCGAPRGTRATTTIAGATRSRSSRAGALEMPISIAWMLAGYGFERIPTRAPFVGVLAEPIVRDGVQTIPPAIAIGRTIQMEAAVAGKRIDKALRPTMFYKVVAPWFDMAGGLVEVGALFAPPLLVGLAALRPEIAQQPVIKSIMVGTLIPILVEQAKLAAQQTELLEKMEGANQETIDEATRIVDQLLGVK